MMNLMNDYNRSLGQHYLDLKCLPVIQQFFDTLKGIGLVLILGQVG